MSTESEASPSMRVRSTRPSHAPSRIAAWLVVLAVASCSNPSAAPSLPIEPLPNDQALPIESLLSELGVPDITDRSREFNRSQELIRECMAKEGFEYFPMKMDTSDDDAVEELPAADLFEYASDYGYGLTTLLPASPTARDLVVAGVLPATADFPEVGDTDGLDDPNFRYAAGLTPAERDAYSLALDGPDPVEGEEGLDLPDADYGCTGEAATILDEEEAASGHAEPSWLDEATRMVNEELAHASGAFEEAEMLWSSCMKEQGFDGFANRIDAPESIRASLLEVVLDAPDLDAEVDGARLHEIHTREMALAAADATCFADPYRPAIRSIQYRIETEVLRSLGVAPSE